MSRRRGLPARFGAGTCGDRGGRDLVPGRLPVGTERPGAAEAERGARERVAEVDEERAARPPRVGVRAEAGRGRSRVDGVVNRARSGTA